MEHLMITILDNKKQKKQNSFILIKLRNNSNNYIKFNYFVNKK